MGTYELRPAASGGEGVEGRHVPVLADEAIGLLCARPGGRYLDGTLGDGGHAEQLLGTDGRAELLGIDRDPLTLAATSRRLARYGARFHAHHGVFSDLDPVLAAAGWPAVDGILLDLGVSSAQLDAPARGFAFQAAGPLDMRMDPGAGPDAAELVATLEADALADLFARYGEEPAARRVARAIVAARARAPITDTGALADLVVSVIGHRHGRHPATRVFQALRIAVNDELGHLDRFLARALTWLAPGGRLVTIAYHSLEDRRVKRALQRWQGRCTCPPRLPRCACGARARARVLTRKVVRPAAAEVATNPRARSARLRACEVLDHA